MPLLIELSSFFILTLFSDWRIMKTKTKQMTLLGNA